MKNVLIVSAGLNLVLAGVCLVLVSRSAGSAEAEMAEVSPVERISETDGRTKGVSVEPVKAEENGAGSRHPRPDLSGLDHNGQVAALVAAGWPEEDAKLYALGRLTREMVRSNPWREQQSNYWESYQPVDMDWETQRKAMEASLRMQEAMKDLLGDGGASMFGGIDLPFSPDKKRAAMMVQMDYQMMEMKLQHDSGGIMLEEDVEARKLLEEARRKDLAAVLTPEELFEFEVRTSNVAGSLRHQLGAMEPTEEEFREIFRWRQEMEKFDQPRPGVAIDEGTQEQRAEAEAAMKAALTESLGEERFKEYERSQDWGYGRLKSVVKRLDLPEERADAVFDVKEFAESRGMEIRQDGELSQEERQEALQALHAETKEGLAELLGEEGVKLYQEQGGGHWLHQFQ